MPLGAVVVGTVATVPVATVVDLKVTAAAAVATSVAVDAVIAVPTGLCSSQCYCSVVFLWELSVLALPLQFLFNCRQTEVEREHWEKARQSLENREVKILTDQDWIDFLPGRGFKAGVDYPISLYYK